MRRIPQILLSRAHLPHPGGRMLHAYEARPHTGPTLPGSCSGGFMLCSPCLKMQFSIILPLHLYFVSEVQKDNGACFRGLEPASCLIVLLYQLQVGSDPLVPAPSLSFPLLLSHYPPPHHCCHPPLGDKLYWADSLCSTVSLLPPMQNSWTPEQRGSVPGTCPMWGKVMAGSGSSIAHSAGDWAGGFQTTPDPRSDGLFYASTWLGHDAVRHYSRCFCEGVLR